MRLNGSPADLHSLKTPALPPAACPLCVRPLLQRASIKLVPRIDLAALAARKPEDARANFGKQPKVRPPARPFNPDEVRRRRRVCVCWGLPLWDDA